MSRKLSVLLAASEALPFVKTGGLADVLGSLPLHLGRQGARVSVVVPFYRNRLTAGFRARRVDGPVRVWNGPRYGMVSFFRARVADSYDLYLVGHDPSFARRLLYGPSGGEYPDNAARFSLFSRAVVRLVNLLPRRTDIVHCHDWQTGLLPLLLKDVCPTVFTIHNMGYQGLFPETTLDALGIPRETFTPEGLEFYGRVNFLKAGIVWSDAVTTVSPGYAGEIQTPENGFGLDGLMRRHAGKLLGILNGADYRTWDPGGDPLIAAPYGPDDLSGKAVCRRSLLREFGLPEDGSPLAAMTTRLALQKGIDILLEALPSLMKTGISLVILGSGDGEFERRMLREASAFPRLRAVIGFDEALAHRILAGADLFLMPSRYEPCGLSQMYALRYGTVPVVRETGGLVDTVQPYGIATPGGVGFTFSDPSGPALATAVRSALDVMGRPSEWQDLVTRGMRRDYSWDRSAHEYLNLYRSLLGGRSTREGRS